MSNSSLLPSLRWRVAGRAWGLATLMVATACTGDLDFSAPVAGAGQGGQSGAGATTTTAPAGGAAAEAGAGSGDESGDGSNEVGGAAGAPIESVAGASDSGGGAPSEAASAGAGGVAPEPEEQGCALPVDLDDEGADGATGHIVVGATGVAFSASPGRSVLKRDVVVYSADGRADVTWSAKSDQPWLCVSSAGKTGKPLRLVADPTGLAAAQTHFATVTVTSGNGATKNLETIRVGLHVLAEAPHDLSLALGGTYVATSPVEPIAFIANGGTDVAGYDVYTGERVRMLTHVVANAGALTLSGDGRSLFVFDRNNLRVQEVDAVTGMPVRSYPSPDSNGGGLLYLRPSAYPTLVVPSGALYDVASGQRLQNTTLYSCCSLMASADGSIAVNESGTVYSVSRSGENGGTAFVQLLFNTGTAQGREGQACLSADGTTVYTASGYPYNFQGVSFSTHESVQVLPGSSYPNAMLCGWNDLVIGGIDGYYDATDIWVYDGPSGVELAKMSSAAATSYRSLVNRGLALSGDGSRLVALSGGFVGSGALETRFQSLPVPP
jgi:hypothetical protein